MDLLLPVLFLDDDGGPLDFAIRGLSADSSLIAYLIKKGGGIVHVRRNGPHTIVLDKPESRIFGEEEYFSCHYISDCCATKCLQDLNKYRLNKHSKYVEDYDANLILLKKKEWKDIPLRGQENSDDVAISDEEISDNDAKHSRKTRSLETLQENSDDVAISDEEISDIDAKHSRKTRSLKTLSRPYRESERLEIIQWIIKNKSYSSVGGNSLWMQMENEEVCQGRTWQSLKEHFKKKIMPTINTFGLSAKHVKCFKTRRTYC